MARKTPKHGGARPGAGRRKLPPDRGLTTTPVGTRLSPTLYARVRELAEAKGISVPAVLREALDLYLKSVVKESK